MRQHLVQYTEVKMEVITGHKYLGNSTNRSEFTDITVTTSGVVYAAGSSVAGGPMNGIRRSTDGINWVDITPTVRVSA